MDSFAIPSYRSAILLAAIAILFIPGVKANGTPNIELPSHIVAPENKLTVFADYAAPDPNGVPLYVVNRTDKAITFPSQDGDIYLMLEYRLPDGSWQRAQVHQDSFCGNSYSSLTIFPGQYLVLPGYSPGSGEKARVRYACYGGIELVSNESDGFILPEDVEGARRDSFGRSVAPSLERTLDPRERMSSGSSPELTVAALRLIQTAGTNPYFQEAAKNLAKDLESKSTASAEEKRAAKAINEILANPWADKRDLEALFARCREAICSPGTNPKEFGRPEDFPCLVWGVLTDLAGIQQFRQPERWKPLIDAAIAHPTSENIRGVANIARDTRIGDELIPTTFFATHIFDPDRFVQAICAEVLIRRREKDQLIEIGWKLPPQSLPIILNSLACSKSALGDLNDVTPAEIRLPGTEVEQKFWFYCLEKEPLESYSALYSLAQSGGRIPTDGNPFGDFLRDPLHNYLIGEAERSKKAASDFRMDSDSYKLRELVEFLASWNQPDDTPLLKDLLDYKGYDSCEETTSGGKRTEIHRFVVRQAAKEALIKRGEPVSADVVLEKRILLPKAE